MGVFFCPTFIGEDPHHGGTQEPDGLHPQKDIFEQLVACTLAPDYPERQRLIEWIVGEGNSTPETTERAA